MIAVLATVTVKDEKIAESEQVVRDLENEVNAKEPDCRLYRMARNRTEPTFRDETAIDLRARRAASAMSRASCQPPADHARPIH